MTDTLQKGTELCGGSGRYKIVSVIGNGSFGITYHAKVEILHGNIPVYGDVAIKEFFMSSICVRNSDGSVAVNTLQKKTFNQCLDDFRKEAEALRDMADNKGIVKVNEMFEANGTCYYVMEHLGDISLKKYVTGAKAIGEEEALSLFCKIAAAVNSLHSQNRLHLDIKPGNIMMVDGEPKLIDFGQSLRFGKSGVARRDIAAACSDGYAPVEQYSGVRTFMPQIDIYALGAVLFFMLTGTKPPRAQELTVEYIDGELTHGISAVTREIIKKCMAREPQDRYACINEILRRLPESVSVEDNDATMLLCDMPDTHWYYSRSMLGVLLGIVAALVVIAGGTVCLRYCGKGKEKAEPPVGVNDTVIYCNDIDTVKPAVAIEQQPEVRKEKTSDVKDKQEQSNGIGRRVVTQEQSGTVGGRKGGDLGWAVWNGGMDSYGRPVGIGTLKVKQTKRLSESVTVYPGDRIEECEFYQNRVYQGMLYREGETTGEYINI